MDLNLRTDALRDPENTRIGDDERIRADLLQFFKIFLHPGKIVIMCQNIRRHIYFYAVFMCERNACAHLFHRKIFRLSAKPESFPADIHGVRSENDGGFQHLKAARRN